MNNINKTYIDRRGYVRYKDTNNLKHRRIAYLAHYNSLKYELPFGKYVVHHIDGDKTNNVAANLEIVTEEHHERIHEDARNVLRSERERDEKRVMPDNTLSGKIIKWLSNL